jgi:hypothetical protein
MNNTCLFCKRTILQITEHHLIPKVLHKKRKIKKRYKKEHLRQTITTCIDCHNHIHRMFGSKDLERKYNTFQLLFDSIEMQKFIKFIYKKC